MADEWKGPFFLNPAMSSSPVVYKDSVILMCAHNGKEDSFLRAVDGKTGEDRWVKPRPSSGTNNATPLLIDVKGKPQLVVSLARSVEGVDPDSGELLWKCSGKGFVPSPAFGSGLLYIDSGVEGPGEAIDPTGSGDVSKSHIRWQIPKLQWSYGSPVISGDYLYRGQAGHRHLLGVSTGEQVFSERLDGVTRPVQPDRHAGRPDLLCLCGEELCPQGGAEAGGAGDERPAGPATTGPRRPSRMAGCSSNPPASCFASARKSDAHSTSSAIGSLALRSCIGRPLKSLSFCR